MLGLGAAQKTPHRRLGQAGHILSSTHSHGTPGDKHQPRIGEALIREPLLQQLEHPASAPMDQSQTTGSTAITRSLNFIKRTIHQHQLRNRAIHSLTQRR
jgi:hypothetical protein